MKKLLPILAIATPLLFACASSMPPPTQRLADAQAAERGAKEVGANSQPESQLSLRLAQEQIAQAEKAMSDEENERADGLLMRARADAELAIAQAREKAATTELARATEAATAQKSTNVGQGAIK